MASKSSSPPAAAAAKVAAEALDQVKSAQPFGPVPETAPAPQAAAANSTKESSEKREAPAKSQVDCAASGADKVAVKPATAVGKIVAGDVGGAMEQEKKKPAQTIKGPDSEHVPVPGKAAKLVDGPTAPTVASAGIAAAAAGTAMPAKAAQAKMQPAKAASPTSAAAVAGDRVEVTAIQRQQVTGSVLATGPGAKSEAAAAPKAKAKATARASSTAAAMPASAAPGGSQPSAAASAGTPSKAAAAPPARVLDIVSGVPQPVLESSSNAPMRPTRAASGAHSERPVGPARAYAAAAAPALCEAARTGAVVLDADAVAPTPVPAAGARDEVRVESRAAAEASAARRIELPAFGPAAVAVGRAAESSHHPVQIHGGKAVARIERKYQIVFITSEVAPFSKTGGLGEAMDGLPVALAALGHRVMVISPRYDQYKEAWDTSFWSSVKMAGTSEACHFFHAYKQKVDYVFVDHPTFLERVNGMTGAKLYGPEWGKDFADNQARFAYFCKAALVAIKDLPLGGYPYGYETVVVANDWHSSLVPMFIHAERSANPTAWKDTKTAFLCHNAVFQGRFEYEEGLAEVFDVPQEYIDSITFMMPLKVGKYNKKVKCVNTMAAGIRYSDRALTVSPTYARECAADPEKGVELEELFALGRITGILNGVKEGVSPADKNFVTKTKMQCGTFTVDTCIAAKEQLKALYRAESGLPDSSGPLMCFIGRLDAQKGYDLLLEALIDVLEDTDIQVVIVGAGREDLVQQTKAVERKFPSKLFYAGWMGPERYALLAGCDFTLLPSRWEPCGLVQMEAMRVGTLPVVAPTGGLRDTVEDGVNGIWTDAEMTVEAEIDEESVASVARALRRAADLHGSRPDAVATMKQAAMVAASEFTWSNAALQYEAIFEELGVKSVLPAQAAATVTLEVDTQVC